MVYHLKIVSFSHVSMWLQWKGRSLQFSICHPSGKRALASECHLPRDITITRLEVSVDMAIFVNELQSIRDMGEYRAGISKLDQEIALTRNVDRVGMVT